MTEQIFAAKEKMKLALDWYDSGSEDRHEFEAMIKAILAEQPAQFHKISDYPELQAFISKGLADGSLSIQGAPPVQQCMEHGECFGGVCIYAATQPAQQTPPAIYGAFDLDIVREWSGWTGTDEDIVAELKKLFAEAKLKQRNL